jgi:GNAT superfamily N-acetyltransferase
MSSIDVFPVTAERWTDLERLLGPRGASGGCWCMWWRLSASEFRLNKGDGNRAGLRAIVEAGREPGLIAYRDGQPAGWCSVAPRPEFVRLEKSRTLKPVDDQPVWSVTCFFIGRGHRRSGVATALLRAAASHARARGARILEGYPDDPRAGRLPDAFAWRGLVSMFRAAGFVEVARRSPGRPIMRKDLDGSEAPRTHP